MGVINMDNKYEEMSDSCISLKIFEIKYGRLGNDKDMLKLWNSGKVDYCNNPADMWPIIVENKISLINHDDEDWFAFQWVSNDAECWHKNPLRAAAIVFLMIKDAE